MTNRENDIHLPVFRSKPEAIALDIDGTLLNSRTQLSERNRSAIEKCLVRGIPVIMATARAARSVNRLLGSNLMQDCSLVMQNGAIARGTHPFSGYFKEGLPEALTREVIDIVQQIEPDVRITIEIDGYEFGTNQPLGPADLWEINSATPEMQLSLESALTKNPAKIAIGGLERDLSHIVRAVSERCGDALSIIPSNGMTFLNITSTSANKPEALRKILNSRQVSLDDVIAIGDDIPDVEMLLVCGTSIAMANAVPEVKAVTGFCTSSNDDDGVALVLEQMLEDIS